MKHLLVGIAVLATACVLFGSPPSACVVSNSETAIKALTGPRVGDGVVSDVAPEASPTPHAEIDRVLSLLPRPAVGFVDFGCGADARWCIAAAKKWNCVAVGVEIDPARAASAKEAVRKAGLQYVVTIVEGDATTTDVQADVGVA